MQLGFSHGSCQTDENNDALNQVHYRQGPHAPGDGLIAANRIEAEEVVDHVATGCEQGDEQGEEQGRVAGEVCCASEEELLHSHFRDLADVDKGGIE